MQSSQFIIIQRLTHDLKRIEKSFFVSINPSPLHKKPCVQIKSEGKYSDW